MREQLPANVRDIRIQDKGQFSSMIDMSYYESATRTFRYDSLYETLASKDMPNLINQVKQLANEAKREKDLYQETRKQGFNVDY